VAVLRYRRPLRLLWRIVLRSGGGEKSCKINAVAVLQFHGVGRPSAKEWPGVRSAPPMCDPLPPLLRLAVVTSDGMGGLHSSGTPALRSPSRSRSRISPIHVVRPLTQAIEKSGRRRCTVASASDAVSISPCIAADAMSRT
jgi:hypothetical protein